MALTLYVAFLDTMSWHFQEEENRNETEIEVERKTARKWRSSLLALSEDTRLHKSGSQYDIVRKHLEVLAARFYGNVSE